MSFEEYQNAVSTGKITSSGEYNIGEHEKGLTYFSSDPLQASSYANGFAPWPFIATPGHPAVVVEVDNKGMDTTVDPHRPTEVGVKGDIPMSAVTRAFIGSPIMISSGREDVKQGMGKPPSMGSGASPSNSLVWHQASIVPGGALDTGPKTEAAPNTPRIEVENTQNYEYARRVALAATDVAKREGFDPTKIVVTDHDEQFELNGMKYNYAGAAGYDGIVTLYSKHMAGAQVFDVTTHEIMHQKFHEFSQDYQEERAAVNKLPTTGELPDGPDEAGRHAARTVCDSVPGLSAIHDDGYSGGPRRARPHGERGRLHAVQQRLVDRRREGHRATGASHQRDARRNGDVAQPSEWFARCRTAVSS